MKLISVGIHEDIFDHITKLAEETDLRVHDVEGTLINLLLRKALGVGGEFQLDPLIEEVLDELEDSHDPSTCETCA